MHNAQLGIERLTNQLSKLAFQIGQANDRWKEHACMRETQLSYDRLTHA